jgi:formylmethanofuran dehydrogenase subunit D
MAAIGVSDGDSVLVRTEFGEAEFKCEAAKVPLGLAFVPYGPPTCRLMGGSTDGTGMPTSKGWEVDVMPVHEA